MHTITVANKRHGDAFDDNCNGFYVGRGTPLGNPFTHAFSSKPGVLKVKTRHEAIERYKGWLAERISVKDPKVIQQLNRIAAAAMKRDITLICYCAPKACHADHIKYVIEQAILANTPKGDTNA